MATIRKRNRNWHVQVRRTGYPTRTRSFTTRKDAVVWSRQTEARLDQGEGSRPINASILKGTRLIDLVERYRAEVSGSKRGRMHEQIVLTAFGRHAICKKHITDLTAQDFAAYRDERLRKVKPATIRRQLATIHNMFEIAKKEWGFPLVTNPLDGIRLPPVRDKRDRRLQPGEWDRLLPATQSCRNRLIQPIVQLALETGMRRGEILGMEWRHINRAKNSLTIPRTKTGHTRTIPLTQRAFAILDGIPADGDRVFPVSANALRLAWERLRRRAGVDDFRFHDIRHEAISRFFEMGPPSYIFIGAISIPF